MGLTQIIPTSWHKICAFIATYKLTKMTYMARAFRLLHTIQKAPREAGNTGWYNFNNWKGFMTVIEKKSKLKY